MPEQRFEAMAARDDRVEVWAPAAVIAIAPSQEAAADRVEREAKGYGNINSRQGRRNRKRKAQRAAVAEAEEAEAAKIAEDEDALGDEVGEGSADTADAGNEGDAEPEPKKKKIKAVRDTKGIDADTVSARHKP